MQDVFYGDHAESDSPKGFRRWVALYVKWGGAILSLTILALIVVWAYRLGVRDAREIPVIRAMDGPTRVAPEDPGGTRIANQGLSVNRILAGDAAQNPDETRRAPASLRLRPEDSPAQTPEPESSPVESAAVEPAPQSAAEPAAEAGDAALPVIGTPETGSGMLRPRSRPESLTRPAPPEAGNEPAPTVAAAAPAGIDPDSLPAGTRLVQLGAFGSPDLAELQWARLLGGHDDLLGSKEHYVQRAESNGRIFYRLRVAGFEDSNAQRAICEALRARSVDCIPVTVR